MIYRVPVKFVFSGNFFVRAENPVQAEKFVKKQCGLVLGGNIHTALPCEVCDWDFNVHPEKITGRVRGAARSAAINGLIG